LEAPRRYLQELASAAAAASPIFAFFDYKDADDGETIFKNNSVVGEAKQDTFCG